MLNIPKLLNNGITVNYWKLTAMVIRPEAQLAEFVLGGWLDEAGYLAGLDPITSTILYLNTDDYLTVFSNVEAQVAVLSAAYAWAAPRI